MGEDDLSGVPAVADARVVGRERADDTEEKESPGVVVSDTAGDMGRLMGMVAEITGRMERLEQPRPPAGNAGIGGYFAHISPPRPVSMYDSPLARGTRMRLDSLEGPGYGNGMNYQQHGFNAPQGQPAGYAPMAHGM